MRGREGGRNISGLESRAPFVGLLGSEPLNLLPLPSAQANFPQALFPSKEEMKPSGVCGRSSEPMILVWGLLFLCVCVSFVCFLGFLSVSIVQLEKGVVRNSRSHDEVVSGREEALPLGG